jgi:hypothetical protein
MRTLPLALLARSQQQSRSGAASPRVSSTRHPTRSGVNLPYRSPDVILDCLGPRARPESGYDCATFSLDYRPSNICSIESSSVQVAREARPPTTRLSRHAFAKRLRVSKIRDRNAPSALGEQHVLLKRQVRRKYFLPTLLEKQQRGTIFPVRAGGCIQCSSLNVPRSVAQSCILTLV